MNGADVDWQKVMKASGHEADATTLKKRCASLLVSF